MTKLRGKIMQIIQLSTRKKQALATSILIIIVALTLIATKAWATNENNAAASSAKTSTYEEYKIIKLAPSTTTSYPEIPVSSTTTITTSTSITQPKAIETTTTTIAVAPIKQATGDVWEALRNCEAGGNYAANTGNGYYGAYQFSQSTWDSMNTGYAFAHEAPPEVQDDAAKRLQARSGWGQWPVCSKVALSKASL